MSYRQSEKLEVIRVVKYPVLGIKQTLRELDVNRCTFCRWYKQHCEVDARPYWPSHRSLDGFGIDWPWAKKRVVETAPEHLDKSPRDWFGM